MHQRLTRDAKWPRKATTDFPQTLELVDKQTKHMKRYIFQPSSENIDGEVGKLHRSWTNIIKQLNDGKLKDSCDQRETAAQDKLKLDFGEGWSEEQDQKSELDFAPNWNDEADGSRLSALGKKVGTKVKESVKSSLKIVTCS